MNRQEYLALFKELTEKMYATTSAKNHDYGGASDPFKNFHEFGELGILIRMSDKFARLKTALVEKRDLKVKDETVEDTALDLSVYCLLLIAFLRNGRRTDLN